MGLFNRRSNNELEALRGELRSMASRLDAADGDKEALAARVEALNADLADERSAKVQLAEEVQGLRSRLDTPLSDPPGEPPPAAPDGAALDEMRQRVESLAEHLATVDGRITTISTELANQLTELSNEVSSAAGGPVDGAVIEALQSGQERLANEQARYQIAFREDLAELATRLKRPGR